MPVTVDDFKELKRLKRPQLLVFAALAGISKRKREAQRTDDALRLCILTARAEKAETATTFADVLVSSGIELEDLLAAEIGYSRGADFAVSFSESYPEGIEITIRAPLRPGEAAEG